jgi:hypothetical protein
MTLYNHSIQARTLFAFALVTLLGMPIGATNAAPRNPDLRAIRADVNIRQTEEVRIRRKDPSYLSQTKALVTQYENQARLVQSQGGDPQPLLDAAAYFASQSK